MALMAGARSILVSSMELTESGTEKPQYLRIFQTPISYVSHAFIVKHDPAIINNYVNQCRR